MWRRIPFWNRTCYTEQKEGENLLFYLESDNMFEKESEGIKNISEASKNFYSIIESIFQPRGINKSIIEGHKKIIDSVIERDDIDVITKAAFLGGYKRMIKEYKNCKTVVQLAFENISENARPQDVEEDWFTFFFDKVRLVSDESVQCLWSQILANEVNTPGKYQRSLLHTLSIMSASQAEAFCNVSRFCMYDYKEDIVHPLIFFSTNVKAYENSRIFAYV